MHMHLEFLMLGSVGFFLLYLVSCKCLYVLISKFNNLGKKTEEKHAAETARDISVLGC